MTGSFNAEKGRYAVKVKGRAKPAGLKPENLRVVFPEAAAKQAARPEFVGLTQDEEGYVHPSVVDVHSSSLPHEIVSFILLLCRHAGEMSDGAGGREEKFWKAKALAEARAAALAWVSESRAQAARNNGVTEFNAQRKS